MSNRVSSKREQIEASVLAATEELLAEGAPFADLGIERIATRAGISRTAFYFYFRDKRDLLLRLTEDVSRRLYAEADTWWSGDAPLEEALRRIGGLYADHGLLLRAVVEVSTYDEEVAGFWRALVERFVTPTSERIGDDAAAFALVWMTERSFYQLLVQPDRLTHDELVAGLVRIWAGATR